MHEYVGQENNMIDEIVHTALLVSFFWSTFIVVHDLRTGGPCPAINIAWFAFSAALVLSGCATLQDLSIYHAGPSEQHPAVGYRCLGLEPTMCSLLENAAAVATVEGYPSYRDDAQGSLVFTPGMARSVFWHTDVPATGSVPLVDSRLIPRHYAVERQQWRDGTALIEVNALIGGVDLSRSDLVTMLVDQFEQGRK
jgi:hypothetical protein